MSMAVNVSTGRPGTIAGAPVGARQLPRLVLLAWGALFLNMLTPSGNGTILPLPHGLAQMISQGSLIVAFVLALLANRKLVLRPNLFLMLLTTLAAVSFIVSLHSEFIAGSVYRGVRLLGFVSVLWLLSPWWGRRERKSLAASSIW